MYKPKKQVRLEALSQTPRMSDVRSVLSEAQRAKGCTVELPWRTHGGSTFSLTVRVELAGGDAVWTLYEGEGARSRVVWSSPFEDIELLYDVLTLSLPSASESKIPEDLAQPAGFAKPAASSTHGSLGSLPQRPDSGPEFFEFLTEETINPPQPAPMAQQQPASAPAPNPQPAPAPQPAPVPPQQPQPPLPPQMPQPQPGQPYPYPPGYSYPPGYGYYPGYPAGYPGYPYPAAYPQGYPAGYAYPPMDAQQAAYMQQQYLQQQYTASTVGVQPGPSSQPSIPGSVPVPATPAPAMPSEDLIKKRPNIMLGNFLVEAGLVPSVTVDAALQLQDLVKHEALSTAKAAEAVRRAHVRGGAVDPAIVNLPRKEGARGMSPPLGQILVEAGVVSVSVLRATLNLQEVIRTGAMSKEDAISALQKECFGDKMPTATKREESDLQRKVIGLLVKSGLVSDFDMDAALKVRSRHGGDIAEILVAAGKLDKKTIDAAKTSQGLIDEGRLDVGKAIIALNYCERSRVGFDEAVEDMGWEKP